jgi:DNA-binding IclR family transcriptional regulator
MSAPEISAQQKKMLLHSSLKALQILNALMTQDDYMAIQQIGGVTGLSSSTVHRVLQELLQCGFVEKDTFKKLYRIGPEMMNLIMQMQMKTSNYLIELSRSAMKHLNDLSSETIHLITRHDDVAVYIAKVECKNQIGLRSTVGWEIPLYCTGGGKALLAYQPESWLEKYFSSVTFKRYTEHTLVTESALRQEMVLIKKQGFALDNSEHNPDVICIAAPIFASSQKAIASISISAPKYRFSLEKASGLAADLLDSTGQISDLLCRDTENIFNDNQNGG